MEHFIEQYPWFAGLIATLIIVGLSIFSVWISDKIENWQAKKAKEKQAAEERLQAIEKEIFNPENMKIEGRHGDTYYILDTFPEKSKIKELTNRLSNIERDFSLLCKHLKVEYKDVPAKPGERVIEKKK